MLACHHRSMRPRAIRCAVALVAAAAMSIAGGRLHAQVIQQAVGGVAISTEGVLTVVKTDTLQDLSNMRRKALAQRAGAREMTKGGPRSACTSVLACSVASRRTLAAKPARVARQEASKP